MESTVRTVSHLLTTTATKKIASAGDLRDAGLIPTWGTSLGEGNGNPLQYSCLENPMDRGAWQTMVHSICKELDMTKGT